jgi:putative hemolysin
MKWVWILTTILILTSCTSPQTPPTTAPVSTDILYVEVANPAAAYCVEQGFKNEIRTATDGSQSGVCIFPDGSECDEWTYFHGECSAPLQATETPVTYAPASDSSIFLSQYVFPTSIDPAKHYLFYLHGKIIEDQGIPAVSPDYGTYEYEAILAKLASYGFTVISEQRTKDIDGMKYAERVAGQVTKLLEAGVSPKNITVVGASKGASIVIAVSSFLANKEMNFILLGTCNPETVEFSKQQNLFLYGNILTIRDSTDKLSGSCEELFDFSSGKVEHQEEIVLHIGTGHGILYSPLDEWIIPTIQWAEP